MYSAFSKIWDGSVPSANSKLLDRLLASIVGISTLFYALAPPARFGLMAAMFVPVCICGFYVGVRKSALIAAYCTIVLLVGLGLGAVPVAPTGPWTLFLTILVWTVSLACCSICVGGMSHGQLLALTRMRETHRSERLLDGLTQVMNRLAFEKEIVAQIEDANATGKHLALLMIDVDHFKRFNDRYGHKAGDFVLREVAQQIKDSIRDGDFVSRYGGEEFVVILPASNIDAANQLGNRMRAAIEQRRFKYNGRTLRLTVSVGVAVSTPGECCESLTERTDLALYTSKHAGRNCVHFHDGERLVPYGTGLSLYDSDNDPAVLDAIADDGYLELATGFPHRRVFYEELKRRVAESHRYGRQLTLVFVNVENYASVVELGTDAELMLLSVIAEQIRGCLRDCDLGCRSDRSEFAIILPDTDFDGALVPAKRICREVAHGQQPVFRGVPLNVTANVGVAAIAPRDDVDGFIERARRAARDGIEVERLAKAIRDPESRSSDQAR